jgi:NAD+ diphosphatase
MTAPTPIAFAGAPLDLAENQRSSTELMAFTKAENARAIILNAGNILVGPDNRLPDVHPQDLIGKDIVDPGPLFLGLDGDIPLFAFALANPVQAENLGDQVKFEHLRALASKTSAHELALAGRAKSLFDWHRSHRFCATCGKESKPRNGGVTRKCPSCETDHFPRVNPVVIMLVLNGDKCLMGRNAAWPDGAFSALAGFVSTGETIEEACVREVLEEVGLNVHSPEYKFCQPWPFPSQLMMGLFCYTDETELTLDLNEVSEARWFSKDVVRGVFNGTDDTFYCPPAFTIAHQLIKNWLEN